MEVQVNEQSPLIQSQDHKEDPVVKKKKRILVCAVITLIIIVFALIFAIFIVPLIAVPIIEHYLNSADLIIQKAELLEQRGRFCDVRIQAILRHYAPIDGEAWSEPGQLDIYVQNRSDLNRYEKVGVMSLPSIYVPEKETFYDQIVVVEITNDRALHDFISVSLVSESLIFLAKGKIDIKGSVLMYKNLRAEISVDQEVTVRGFKDIDFTLNYMDLIWGKENEVYINFDITIHNPSPIFTSYPLSFYAQDLGIYYNDTWIGFCQPDDIIVGYNATANKLLGTLVRKDNNEAFIADFLSRYILGQFVFIYVKGTGKLECGFPQTLDYPADIYVPWLLPGIQDLLIQELYAPLNEVEYFPQLKLVAEGKMYNPLEFAVELIEVDFDGYVGHPCNETLGHIHEEYDPPFVMPSKQPICLRGLVMRIPIADATCMLDGGVFRGIILYAQKGSMVLKVELFIIRVPFEYGPLVGNLGKCRDP